MFYVNCAYLLAFNNNEQHAYFGISHIAVYRIIVILNLNSMCQRPTANFGSVWVVNGFVYKLSGTISHPALYRIAYSIVSISSRLTWKRMDAQMLVELANCFSESVENTELVPTWNHVDVADLLVLDWIIFIFRHNPQSSSQFI